MKNLFFSFILDFNRTPTLFYDSFFRREKKKEISSSSSSSSFFSSSFSSFLFFYIYYLHLVISHSLAINDKCLFNPSKPLLWIIRESLPRIDDIEINFKVKIRIFTILFNMTSFIGEIFEILFFF